MTEIEKAYAAGFFDGEGYVGLGRNYTGKSFTLGVTVGQNDVSVLYWLKDKWNGNICYRTKGCPVWQTYSATSAAFLIDVAPYLIVKKAQVDYILKVDGPYTEEHFLKVRKLKREFMEAIRNGK